MFQANDMEEQTKQEYLILFGEGLRKLRANVGLSQEELAERAGIDRSYLGAIERGEHNLALINIVKIAHALKLNPHELLETLANKSVKK
jgi:transcriptional regulator with XRE-family HTH domain